MTPKVRVWNTAHELGDVVIAEFGMANDAELFAKAKAKREGGFVSTLLVGTSYENRKSVSVD